MAITLYNTGLDLLGGDPDNWSNGGDFRALLLQGSGYTPNRDDVFVDDLVPGSNEVTGAGYSREVLASLTRTPTPASDRIIYGAADPNFGSIAAGETVTAMVIFLQVTNDADSLLVGWFQISPSVDSGDIVPFVVNFNPTGVFYTDQGS